VLQTAGEEEVILVTAQASAIRFKESDVRPTGLGAGGMRGIKLENDQVIGANLAPETSHLVTITEEGVAKSTPLGEYPIQGRAGGGVIAMKLPNDSKGLAASLVVNRLDETIIILTTKNRSKTVKASAAPAVKRAQKGDVIIALGLNEKIAALVPYLLPKPVPNPLSNGASEP
jgi:DNA gyrase subunit A